MAFKLLLLLAASLAATSAYHGPDLPPGPYCGSAGRQCCQDRQDGCSHPIKGTLCYCDEFCNRNRTNNDDDCCPDYETVCLGLSPVTEIAAPIVDSCHHKGRDYPPGDQIQVDCNTCTCRQNPGTNDVKWDCTNDPCIISEDVIRTVNNMNVGWRAYNYTQFHGKKLADGLIYKLGTLPLNALTKRMNAMGPPDKNIVYPPSFDAREHWPGYITPVRDQGWCGTDWAITLTTIASDRFAILSKGAERPVLSPQMLLSCNDRSQHPCRGGYIDKAWNYARNHGLVDEDCFPYEAAKTPCRFRKFGTLLSDGCKSSVAGRTERYRVSPLGRLKGEKAIMADIMKSGPLQAIMTVHQDFFHYRDGVYRHTQAGNNYIKGLHSVRVIGWGEDRGHKYWLVANSWGQDWGENGYFRIARGSNESGIEDFVVSAFSDVSTANQRK